MSVKISHPFICGQYLGRKVFTWCGRLRLQVSLRCSDTASHCFSIQNTEGETGEGEKRRDQALVSEEAGEEVEWAKQEHRGFCGWIRDRESLSIPALMPKLWLNQGCFLHLGFNGSSVIYLYSLNLFTLQVHREKGIFIGDFYRCRRFVLISVLASVFTRKSAFAFHPLKVCIHVLFSEQLFSAFWAIVCYRGVGGTNKKTHTDWPGDGTIKATLYFTATL